LSVAAAQFKSILVAVIAVPTTFVGALGAVVSPLGPPDAGVVTSTGNEVLESFPAVSLAVIT
jgi:hypothetical protein